MSAAAPEAVTVSVAGATAAGAGADTPSSSRSGGGRSAASGHSSHHHRRHARDTVRMVHIGDSSTGVTLFSKVWAWAPGARSEGVASLVHSFFQFAREVGGGAGGVRTVRFEPPRGASAPRPAGGGRRDAAMEMACTAHGPIRVAVVYAASGKGPSASAASKLGDFARRVAARFAEDFAGEVEGRRELIKDVADRGEQDAPGEELLGAFEGFEEVVESMRVAL